VLAAETWPFSACGEWSDEKETPVLIKKAYDTAVDKLRVDPHFALLVPTLLDLAASYRHIVPGTPMSHIRDQARQAGLRLSDQ